jgi:hypothetical protein
MATLQDFKADLPLLVETALIAIKQGDEESAKKLFSAVGVLDPKNTIRQLGFGLISLHKMELPQAMNYFQEILGVEPKNYRAMAFLGFTHMLNVMGKGKTSDEQLASLKKAAELSQEVLNNSDVPTTRQLAQSVLDWENELQAGPQKLKGRA